MSQHGSVNGTITGIALAAAAHWARYDGETQRRLRNVRQDAEEALDRIHDMQSHGEAVRRQLPTVLDAQVGIAIASPQPTSASVVPITAPMSRPDLSAQLETPIAELTVGGVALTAGASWTIADWLKRGRADRRLALAPGRPAQRAGLAKAD